MRVLVLGGSVFLGRAMVERALARGAEVTVFNRGRSGPTPAGAEQITGDRQVGADLDLLTGREFDVVIDTSGYRPVDVAASAEALARSSERYVLISTVNVYPQWPHTADYAAAGVHDGDPDAAEAPADLDPADSYGWLKAGCEQAAVRAFGEHRTTVLRAGCIVGPHDSEVGRLPWWIDRVARGGDVLVPGNPDDPIALIDARDLADFALAGATGTFHTGGPTGRDTRGDLMDRCGDVTGADARFRWVGDDWLAAQDVTPWTEVPLWAPGAPGLFAGDNADAIAAGLRWRPLHETVSDVWAWQQQVPGGWNPAPRTPGLTPEREAELLTAHHSKGKTGGD